MFTFVLVLCLFIQKYYGQCASFCTSCYMNSDFALGTIRIQTPNQVVCIGEDIIFQPYEVQFNPNTPNAMGRLLSYFPKQDNDNYPGSTPWINGPYALGFIAAFTVEANDTTIDLQGRTIKMGDKFYLQQRWFSIIEVGNSPFIPTTTGTATRLRQTGTQGPNDFLGRNDPFIFVSQVTIQNGTIGLSSHHGIHGNGATRVIISSIKVVDFEVCGIQFNGFNTVVLSNVDIGPSTKQLEVTGFYSHARFILGTLQFSTLKDSTFPFPFVTGNRTYQEIREDLEQVLDMVFNYVMSNGTIDPGDNNELWKYNKHIFLKEENDTMADGASVYGLLFNRHGDATGNFGGEEVIDSSITSIPIEEGNGLTLFNVSVHDIEVKVLEIPVMLLDKCNDNSAIENDLSSYVMKGPFGDVIDVRYMFNIKELVDNGDSAYTLRDMIDTGYYDTVRTHESYGLYGGNVLANAKIAFGLASWLGDPFARNGFSANVNIDKDNGRWSDFATNPLLKWAFGYEKHLDSCTNHFMCNGDVMNHVNKGAFGVRIDGIENVRIDGLHVDNIKNHANVPSMACQTYNGLHDGSTPGAVSGSVLIDEQGMTGDAQGVSIHDSSVVMMGKNSIGTVISQFGDVNAVKIFGENVKVNCLSPTQFFTTDQTKLFAGNSLSMSVYELLLELDQIPFPNSFDMCQISVDHDSDASFITFTNDTVPPFTYPVCTTKLSELI